MPWLFCGLCIGLLLGLGLMAWIVDLCGLCSPEKDLETGIWTVYLKGTPHQLMPLLGEKEAVKDDQLS